MNQKHKLRIVMMLAFFFGLVGLAFVNGGALADTPAAPSLQSGPSVVVTSPINNQRFQPNQAIDVVVTAVDAQGVQKLDLVVNGQVLASHTNPSPKPNQPVLVNFRWTPNTLGTQVIEIVVYNVNNQTGSSGQIFVQVVSAGNLEATPTPAGVFATPTPNYPYLLVSGANNLNVRSGPSTAYPIVGKLNWGDKAQITGRNDVGQGNWWQIVFPNTYGQYGWVSGDTALVTSFNTGNVYVVNAPPPPAPTATPVPPTPTPLPGPNIQFSVDRNRINSGECVNFYWNVSGVRAVYFNGQGVAGENQTRRECPTTDTNYQLRVEMMDGSVAYRDIMIYVNYSSGGGGTPIYDLEKREGEGINFDDGGRDSGGNDFTWIWRDGRQQFERWDEFNRNTLLAEIGYGDQNRLAAIGQDECRQAIDSSPRDRVDVQRDKIVCFRTDQGRYGKLRFRDVSGSRVKLQWYTW